MGRGELGDPFHVSARCQVGKANQINVRGEIRRIHHNGFHDAIGIAGLVDARQHAIRRHVDPVPIEQAPQTNHRDIQGRGDLWH